MDDSDSTKESIKQAFDKDETVSPELKAYLGFVEGQRVLNVIWLD